MSKTQMLICPYCGEAQPLGERCRACRGLFEPLSRQATHNSMGPWFIRDVKRPHRPGCSYETLVRLIERGQLDRFSIIRGPTTRQFWAVAKRVPGVSHLLGYCHNCDAHVEPMHHGCPKCGVPFGAFLNRNYLGLPDIRPLPWEAELDLKDRKQMSGNGDGHGSEPRGFSSYAGAGPQRNVGISSFATDEELTGPLPAAQIPASAAPVSGAAASRGGAVTSDEPEFVDVPGEEPGLREEAKAMAQAAPATAAAAAPGGLELPGAGAGADRMTRSLRATVMRQRRTIRVLTFVIIGVAILSLAFSVILIQMLPGRESNSAEDAGAPGERVNTDVPGAAQPPAATNDAIGREGAAAPIVNDVDNGPPALDEPEADPALSAEDTGSEQSKAALAGIAEARELLEDAADQARSLDNRIADCERAVQLLETSAGELPAASLPADFAELLKRAQTDLERLRLSKFFP
jgi:hypothetical protein